MEVFMNTLKCNDLKLTEDFYEIEEAKAILISEYFNLDLFEELINKFFLVGVKLPRAQQKIVDSEKNKIFLHKMDILICNQLMKINDSLSEDELNVYGLGKYWYEDNFFVKRIKIAQGTFIVYKENEIEAVPVFIRNILYNFSKRGIGEKCDICKFEFLSVVIITDNLAVREYVENALYRKHLIDRIKYSSFANSSSYMGSKKKIVGFIIEAILPHAGKNTVFLDLMCGSGAVSNALAQIGDVYASDAERFCQLLAKIQGKGYSKRDAQRVINDIYGKYYENLTELQMMFKNELAEEDRIFHRDLNKRGEILHQYETFISSFSLYSSSFATSGYVKKMIDRRKENHSLFPYCLCTYYFTNIYFGLAQSIQIDSIRYAIDSIGNREDREWALGALIVTLSMIGTTSAGHFAQPKRMDVNTLENILFQREKSAWLEFSKRFITLAGESERYPYPVSNLNGPWQRALQDLEEIEDRDIIVYLDAPYKREEYSRYYHVLETITLYDYPESENKGRIRSKEKGERFRTEFFTKNSDKVEKSAANIILSILNQGMVCAWSYSDNGDAYVKRVIDLVKSKCRCDIYIYGIPHVHQTQKKKIDNKKSILKVVEYCIIFKKSTL